MTRTSCFDTKVYHGTSSLLHVLLKSSILRFSRVVLANVVGVTASKREAHAANAAGKRLFAGVLANVRHEAVGVDRLVRAPCTEVHLHPVAQRRSTPDPRRSRTPTLDRLDGGK